MDSVQAQQFLDAFLVDNEELEMLNARLSEFNLFSVLRVGKAEIRHSNMLAWLFTPNEAHGLGATILRRFLSSLLMEHQFDDVQLTAAQVELMDFGDIEVYRERHNIDILVRSRGGKWCLLIENKIKASESKGQLQRYREAVEREFPDHQIVPVYLTLFGDDVSDGGIEAGFVSHSHAQVLELVEQVQRQHGNRMPADVKVLIRHYLVTLRRLTMEDPQIIDLCRSIYRKHRAAIDLINDYGAISEVTAACEAVLEEHATCEFRQAARGRLWFVPSDLGEVMPSVPMNGWRWLEREVPVVCWFVFSRKRGSVQLTLEVGPMANAKDRQALLKSAKKQGFKVPDKALSDGAKLTRLHTESQKLKVDENGDPDQDYEYLRTVAEKLWTKFWPDAQKIVPAVDAVKFAKD